MTGLFLAWFLTYVLCSAYSRTFMATRVAGNVNVAMVFGLGQFLTTFGIAFAYARFAAVRLDPFADRIRAELRAAAQAQTQIPQQTTNAAETPQPGQPGQHGLLGRPGQQGQQG